MSDKLQLVTVSLPMLSGPSDIAVSRSLDPSPMRDVLTNSDLSLSPTDCSLDIVLVEDLGKFMTPLPTRRLTDICHSANVCLSVIVVRTLGVLLDPSPANR